MVLMNFICCRGTNQYFPSVTPGLKKYLKKKRYGVTPMKKLWDVKKGCYYCVFCHAKRQQHSSCNRHTFMKHYGEQWRCNLCWENKKFTGWCLRERDIVVHKHYAREHPKEHAALAENGISCSTLFLRKLVEVVYLCVHERCQQFFLKARDLEGHLRLNHGYSYFEEHSKDDGSKYLDDEYDGSGNGEDDSSDEKGEYVDSLHLQKPEDTRLSGEVMLSDEAAASILCSFARFNHGNFPQITIQS